MLKSSTLVQPKSPFPPPRLSKLLPVMAKLVPLKPREIERILVTHGFSVNVSKSSHRQYFNPKTKAHVTVPFHSKDIPTGTLRSIIRQSQLPPELYRK